MNKLKCIVLNTRSGVGKSTVALQLLAPYIFNRFKKITKLYELNDKNDEAVLFKESCIVEFHKCLLNDDLKDTIREILLKDEHMILDIGANKTATAVLSTLMDSSITSAVNLIVIPLLNSEQDAKNAIMTYISMRDSVQKQKILFVLNRYNDSRNINSQFDVFLGDERGSFDQKGLISYAKNGDKNIVFLVDSDVIKYTNRFYLSVYELAQLRDIDSELQTALEEGKDAKTIQLLQFKKLFQNDAIQYTNQTLIKAFKKIDDVLQG